MVTGDNGYFGKGVAQPLVLFNPGDSNLLIEQETQTFPSNDALEVDDLYFQFGKTNAWDVQIGRFEAINLVPLGKDTLVANVGGVQVYEANIARGRKDDVLHAAFHVGSADKFLFELGVMANKNGDDELQLIVGTPREGEQLGDETFDGQTQKAIFPGDLPENSDSIFEAVDSDHEDEFEDLKHINFVRFRPPLLKSNQSKKPIDIPHIRLDRALEFLIGDRLQ